MRQTTGAMGHAYRCPRCGRGWFVVGDDSADTSAKCPCGSPLVADALAAGTYEIQEKSPASSGHRARKHGAASSSSSSSSSSSPSSLPVEDDLGYGASHGYGPSHGGPTGPGDAPAVETDVAPSSSSSRQPNR